MTSSGATDREGTVEVRLRQTAPIPLDVSFDCRRGELIALVGPSGSGKTTILRCIAGLNTPDMGRVSCAGSEWLDTDRGIDLPPQKRSIGIVFQHYALFPHLCALDNIIAAMQHLPAERRHERALQLLDTVNLNGLESRRPQQLSGGQQQRVALAREPGILLLDEPFSSVDQATRRKLQRELASLRGRMAHPIVLVTHDVEEACMLADRICILHRGKSLQIGSPTEILNRPRHKLAAHLVGLTNVFSGTVREHIEERRVTLLQWGQHVLEIKQRPDIAAGDTVDWVIPSRHILLHQRVRPSRGERENPVGGTIDELVVLGETASVTLLIDGRDETPLTFNLPMHVVERNRLWAGDSVSVSLRGDGIHLMVPDNGAQP